MGKAWSRFRPSSRTARILLAALFAFPIFSSLILLVFSSYAGIPYDFPEFGPAVFQIPALVLVEFPMAGFIASLITFGSIFLWEWHRKSLSIGWLAWGVWSCFIFLVAQCSAPLWYHRDADWGYTFSFEQSLPFAGIMGGLFFIVGFSLGKIAFEPDDRKSTESNGSNR